MGDKESNILSKAIRDEALMYHGSSGAINEVIFDEMSPYISYIIIIHDYQDKIVLTSLGGGDGNVKFSIDTG